MKPLAVRVQKCKTFKDFENEAAKEADSNPDVEFKQCKNHWKVTVFGRGSSVGSRGGKAGKQLGKGMISSILRQWKMIGLLAFISCFLLYVAMNMARV